MENENKKIPFWKNKKFWYVIGILMAIGLVQDLTGKGRTQKNELEKIQQDTVAGSGTVKTENKEEKEVLPEQKLSKEEAQKELDKLIDLSKQIYLVTSYEFSKSASVVYVGKGWYSQPVTFKKDFIAKVGLLKKQITGYSHFELRDYISNEKVGEITSFGSSIEVYK